MNFPGYNETSSFGGSNVPAEGWHNVSLKNMVYDVSKSGNDMLVATMVIDAGDDAMLEQTEYLVQGHESGVGESKLKGMAENVRTEAYPEGFEWTTDVASWDEFAGQFVQSPPLRFAVKIAHEFSVETERGWKNDVSEEMYEEYSEDPDKKARVSGNIVAYSTPDAAPEIDVDPNAVEEPSEDNGFPEYAGDGAGAADSDDGDDGLPF